MLNPFLFNDPLQAYGVNAQYASQMGQSQNQLQGTLAQAQAQMYGADASLAGGMYGANTNFNINDLTQAATTYRTLEGLKNAIELQRIQNQGNKDVANIQYGSANYGADRTLEGQKYTADASSRNNFLNYLASTFGSQQQADASKYGSLAGLRGQQYQADAQQNIAGGNNISNLAAAKMQAEASMAPTNAKLYTFGKTFPVLLDILRKKRIL